MSLTSLAVLTGVAYGLCILINYGFGQIMTERPIIVGTVVGLFLGDVKTGVIVGTTLEVAYMGVVNIGGVTATDAASSTAIATAFSIYSGLTVEEAVAIAIPVGVVFNTLSSLTAQLMSLGVPILDKICEEGNEKGLYLYEVVIWLICFGIRGLIVGLIVGLGADPLTAFIGNIPTVISHGLSVAAGLLGAVGMAMLMRMLWSKEVAIYYFLGFVLVKYLGVSTMGIAAIGLIIAIAAGLREKQIIDLEKKMSAGVVTSTSSDAAKEEEDFLS